MADRLVPYVWQTPPTHCPVSPQVLDPHAGSGGRTSRSGPDSSVCSRTDRRTASRRRTRICPTADEVALHSVAQSPHGRGRSGCRRIGYPARKPVWQELTQRPCWQTSSLPHVPQEPPQPSSPQGLVAAHRGMHRCFLCFFFRFPFFSALPPSPVSVSGRSERSPPSSPRRDDPAARSGNG